MTPKGASAGATSGAARGDVADLLSGDPDLRSLLGRNEGFLTTIVESMPGVVFVKDSATGRFILLNRAGEEFLGVSRAAIVGKTDHDFFPKEGGRPVCGERPQGARIPAGATRRGGAGPYPA